MIEKKNLSLLPTSKKLTFLILPRKRWLTLLEAQIYAFFEVKDHKRLVLNIIFVVFGIFVTFLITLGK